MTQTQGSVGPVVHDLCRDALAIVPMYARLHSLGLEGGRGETVHVTGGQVSDPTGRLAAESHYAEQRRAYAEWVYRELSRAAKIIARVEQGLERNVGPGPGYRQPVSIGSDAIVTVTELTFSLERQADRMKAGNE